MIFLLLGATLAHAAVDTSKIPEFFCEPALSVSERVESCVQNRQLTDAANACMAKLNQLESTFGEEAKAISQKDSKNQQGQAGTGKTEYDFSASAMRYLSSVASVGLAQTKEYEDYVDVPDDFFQEDTDDVGALYNRANNTDCYGGGKKRLQKVQQDFGSKIAMYKARELQAENMSKTLKGTVSGFSGSAAEAPLVKNKSQGSTPIVGKDRTRDSDVTGKITNDNLKTPVK
ncbi:MAG: hypothetical protein ACXVBE_01480 [Bdellovibrionota bacterium]